MPPAALIGLPHARLVFGVYTALLTVASLLPASELPTGVNFNDKAAHAACYLLFAILAAALCASWRRYALVAAGLVLFGLLMEGAQGISGGREASLLDALANAVGVAGGYGLVALHKYRRRA